MNTKRGVHVKHTRVDSAAQHEVATTWRAEGRKARKAVNTQRQSQETRRRSD